MLTLGLIPIPGDHNIAQVVRCSGLPSSLLHPSGAHDIKLRAHPCSGKSAPSTKDEASQAVMWQEPLQMVTKTAMNIMIRTSNNIGFNTHPMRPSCVIFPPP